MKEYFTSPALLTIPLVLSPIVCETSPQDAETKLVSEKVAAATEHHSITAKRVNPCSRMSFGECLEWLVGSARLRVIHQEFVIPIMDELENGNIQAAFKLEEKLTYKYPEEYWHCTGLMNIFARHAMILKDSSPDEMDDVIALFSKSIECWEKITNKFPTIPRYNVMLAGLHLEKAKSMLEVMNKREDDINPDFLHQNPDISDLYKQATVCYESAMANGETHYKALIDLYIQQGNHDKLATIIQEYHDYNPEEPMSHFQLAILHWQRGDINKAMEIFLDMMKKFDGQLSLLQLSAMADFFVHNGRRAEGMALYEAIINSSEEVASPDIYVLYSTYFPEDAKKALQAVQKGLAHYPSYQPLLERYNILKQK